MKITNFVKVLSLNLIIGISSIASAQNAAVVNGTPIPSKLWSTKLSGDS